MMLLRSAFEKNDINQFQKILQSNDTHILFDDPFINQYRDDLFRIIRLDLLIASVKPYKSVSLSFLAKEVNVSIEDICCLLSELILEEKIKGKIDQPNGFLEMSQDSKKEGGSRHEELCKWASSLSQVHS